MKTTRWITWAVAGWVSWASLSAPAVAATLTHGPMIGALGVDSTVVWARWDVPGTARIRYRSTGATSFVDGPSDAIVAERDLTGRFTLGGLKANTSYLYTLEFTADTGEVVSTPSAWFRTPAKLPTSLSFSVLADFMTKEKAAPALRAATSPRPAFALIIGDLDHSDPARQPGTQDYLPVEDAATALANMRQMRRATRDPSRPVGADFVKAFVTSKTAQQVQIPLYYVWDDHDFCKNGADAACPFVDQARQVYSEYFLPAADNGLAGGLGCEGRGVWQRFAYGGLAEFFLLDARSNRGALGSSLLGTCQKQWLLDGLARSTANWKFIVSPVTFNPGTKPWDAWGAFADERAELLGFIRERGIANVVVLSGDIHSGGAIDDGSHAGLPEVSVPHANMPATWVDTYCRLDPQDNGLLVSAPGTWTLGGLVDANLQNRACLGNDYSKKRLAPPAVPPYPLAGASNPGFLRVDLTASLLTIRVMDAVGQLKAGYAADGSPADMKLELSR
ncbi:alkaline phosphatase D family protein [Ideonella sp.]|uniref:alkaline phosphatase D family protein n=1 Tax=Ideonella sp. TaxID=1929293 RepID=UPI002B4848F5|nr:alkaline phosphatase D family protein [Ideonella sp.]HJV70852.1 alkaline phosphatase D family protein [Ideonella sp.]